jgi:hypothetical protein
MDLSFMHLCGLSHDNAFMLVCIACLPHLRMILVLDSEEEKYPTQPPSWPSHHVAWLASYPSCHAG